MLPLSLSHILRPSLTELGRLPARTTSVSYPGIDALEGAETPWRLSFDGSWRFQLVAGPDRAPDDWVQQDTHTAPWRDIQVPGVWTRQETGDLPHYTNWRMPFDCQYPPEVPQDNPTGLYRRSFALPQGWEDRRTILHIGGFESLALVWCNGQFVGMGKDSRLPSEFDLTEHLHTGENDLAIMVLRWCDATWIEDQDHWNHGGLHRSVYLESRGQVHVSDIVVDTDFEPETGTGLARIAVHAEGGSQGYTVRASLDAANGQAVIAGQTVPVAQFDPTQSLGRQWAQSYAFKAYAATMEFAVPKAQPWSAERPARYRLITELIAPGGEVAEVHETWIGFTRIETSDRRLKLNGQPIVLIGVNRHDHHPENGKTCSREDIRAELLTMKQHNINAIRTAHYPNDPALLDLADELGFYVIDEANVECHARWSEVAHRTDYHHAIIERTTRMIARDRNHPCIIGWSLGNEAGHGPAQDAAAAAARHLDPSRFVHYEGAVSMRFSFPFGRSPDTTQQPPSAHERAATDVVCPMYPPIDHIVDWARWAEESRLDERPLLLCEFSHAMGNSNGSIADYVDAFFSEPALAGGFVWDWRDQGLAETDAQGHFYWAYGGHYGDDPNDGNFNINGLVGPDGIPHPALREYMWAARPVISERVGPRHIRIHNRRVFEDTSDLYLEWQLCKAGEVVEQGQLQPVIAPKSQTEIEIPYHTTLSAESEWHLNLVWRLQQACLWASADHSVAWDQLELSTFAPAQVEPPPFPADPRISGTSFQHGDLLLEIGRDGGIERIYVDDDIAISSPITPCVWRAPTDNDGGKPGSRSLFRSKTVDWVTLGLNALRQGELQTSQMHTKFGTALGFRRYWHGNEDQKLTHQSVWRFVEDKIIIDEKVIVPEIWQDLPRIGIRFGIPEIFTQLEWYGPGPDESYPDRYRAQMVGLWRSTIANQYHPHVRPQEYGAHEQVRLFRLLRQDRTGFQITLPRPLSVTARPHHDADLNEAETLAELVTRGRHEVHIDAAMRGLGTGACGPDTLPAYRVGPGHYDFRWELQAITN